MSGAYLLISELPGTWQFWGEAEDGRCWLAPVDSDARAAASGTSELVRSGFALVSRASFSELTQSDEASLF